MSSRLDGGWQSIQAIAPKQFQCGYCGNQVGADHGWSFSHRAFGNGWALLAICPVCQRPTFFESNQQNPGVPYGGPVGHLPKEIEALYDESRTCIAAGANTAAVLASRKLLMHIAVEQGAQPGQSFIQYVEYLAAKGYVPPHGKGWVDHIRTKGNEANHEITLMSVTDAQELIIFSEMLLKFIFEFPSRVPKPPTP